MFKERKCPGCGSTKCTRALVKSKTNPINMHLDEIKPFWSGFFKEKIVFDYVRCECCSLLYNHQYFNQNELDELYKSMAPNMEIATESLIAATQVGYVDILDCYAKYDSGFLELGPDVGHFVKNIIKKNKNTSIVLIEPNISVHSQLAEISKGSNIEIYDDINSIDKLDDGSLSEVVMIQVLDHLLEPKEILKRLWPKLKKGGAIFTVTHNERSFMARILGNRWPAYCLQHPQVYNKKSIRNIFYKSGYEVVDIRKTKNHFEIGFLIKQLAWIFGINIVLTSNIFRNKIGLKLGNIATVAIKS